MRSEVRELLANELKDAYSAENPDLKLTEVTKRHIMSEALSENGNAGSTHESASH
jgi:hypothetical protein